MSDDLATLSVKELKTLIASAGLSSEGCVDKSDLRERGAEAQAKLRAGRTADPANWERNELLPLLEAAVAEQPTSESAERARECLERLVDAMSEGWEPQRDRMLSAVLGALKMGLGGQGGLFMMACLPLPFLISVDDDETTAEEQLGQQE